MKSNPMFLPVLAGQAAALTACVPESKAPRTSPNAGTIRSQGLRGLGFTPVKKFPCKELS